MTSSAATTATESTTLWYQSLGEQLANLSPTVAEIEATYTAAGAEWVQFGLPLYDFEYKTAELLEIDENDSMVLTIRLGGRGAKYIVSQLGVVGPDNAVKHLTTHKTDALCEAYAYFIPRILAQRRAMAKLKEEWDEQQAAEFFEEDAA